MEYWNIVWECNGFEAKPLHSHKNLYKSNLCNTTPLIKQE